MLLVAAAAWEALSFGAAGLASPPQVIQRLVVLLCTPGFWADIAATGWAFLLAATISLLGGFALGAALGTGRFAGAVLQPIVVNLYSLPKVTFYPVVLLLFGLGTPAKVAFGVMHGLVPLTLFTMSAIVNIPPILLRTAAVMRLTRRQTLVFIILPAILPEMLAGARLCVSLSLLGVLIGEMFASTRGLGHRVMTAMEAGDMATVLAVAMLLAAFAIGLSLAMSRPAQAAF